MNKQSDVIANLDDLDGLDLDLDTDGLTPITDTTSIDDSNQNNAEDLELDLGDETTQDTKQPSLDDLNLDEEEDDKQETTSNLDGLNLDDEIIVHPQLNKISPNLVDIKEIQLENPCNEVVLNESKDIPITIPKGLENEPDLSFDVNTDKTPPVVKKPRKSRKSKAKADVSETVKPNDNVVGVKNVTYIHECEIEKIKTDRYKFLSQKINETNREEFDKHMNIAIEKYKCDNKSYMILDCHMVNGEIELFNLFNIFELLLKAGITHVSVRLFENYSDYDIIKFAKISQTN